MAKRYSPKPIRVLVVDDHALVREGLKTLIETAPDMQLVGEAANGERALELASKLRPQVVIMDVALPEANSVQATRQIKARFPEIQVLALSAYSNDFVQGMLKAGAGGYLTRNFAPPDLLEAIRQVCGGKVYFSPGISRKAKAPSNATGEAWAKQLTGRETEVLQLIAEGFTNKEIAGQLNIGTRTVETHREGIMRKLHINNIADLTRYAVAHGLVSLGTQANPLQPASISRYELGFSASSAA